MLIKQENNSSGEQIGEESIFGGDYSTP